MKSHNQMARGALAVTGAVFCAMVLNSSPAFADCRAVGISNAALTTALQAAVVAGGGGLGNDMWATIVDRDGVVCQVAKSAGAGEQWPGSRVISAQKANTANSFSLPAGAGGIPGLALSTANLWAATQPGGSLFGLQFSNPVDTAVAYDGSAATWGTNRDNLKGEKIGGVNVFGGGLALYAEGGNLLGAVGVSGDTSCADHNIAWRVRDALPDFGAEFVPAGVAPAGNDGIIYDVTFGPRNASIVSAGGFGHPLCGFNEQAVAIAIGAGG